MHTIPRNTQRKLIHSSQMLLMQLTRVSMMLNLHYTLHRTVTRRHPKLLYWRKTSRTQLSHFRTICLQCLTHSPEVVQFLLKRRVWAAVATEMTSILLHILSRRVLSSSLRSMASQYPSLEMNLRIYMARMDGYYCKKRASTHSIPTS